MLHAGLELPCWKHICTQWYVLCVGFLRATFKNLNSFCIDIRVCNRSTKRLVQIMLLKYSIQPDMSHYIHSIIPKIYTYSETSFYVIFLRAEFEIPRTFSTR